MKPDWFYIFPPPVGFSGRQTEKKPEGLHPPSVFWGIIKNHGIRNILLPAITIQFLSFNELFGGTILVEQVFAYPGIGQATVAAGLRSDVPLLLGIVIISAIFVFTGNLIADILLMIADPRLRIK